MGIFNKKLVTFILLLVIFFFFSPSFSEELFLENGVWKNRQENLLESKKDTRHSYEKYGNYKNDGIVNEDGPSLLNEGSCEYDLGTQASCFKKIALFRISAINDFKVKEVNTDSPSELHLYMRDGQSILMSCKGSTLFVDVRK